MSISLEAPVGRLIRDKLAKLKKILKEPMFPAGNPAIAVALDGRAIDSAHQPETGY
jgi:hypothetical protein